MAKTVGELTTTTPTSYLVGTSSLHSKNENGDTKQNNGAHSMSPDLKQEIKNEPPEEIDEIGQDSNSADMNSGGDADSPMPKIRLTPTAKLLATASPSDPKRKFVCPYDNCTKSYGKSSHLRSHLTWHTGIKPFVCQEPTCGRGFTRSDELNRHIRTHTGEKPFECIQCTKKFSRSDHLTKHLMTHSKQLPNKLTKPEKKRSAPTPSQTIAPPTKLPTTQLEYADQMHFMSNLSSDFIKRETERVAILAQENQIVPTAITSNQRSPSPESEEMILPVEPFVEVKVKQENEIDVNDNDNIDEVNNDDAIMTEANMFVGLPNGNKRTKRVRKPMTTTTINKVKNSAAYDERPYPCTNCQKAFRRQDDLTRHMRSHTGEKPYECSECDRRFMRSDHLKKHMNTHLRIR